MSESNFTEQKKISGQRAIRTVAALAHSQAHTFFPEDPAADLYGKSLAKAAGAEKGLEYLPLVKLRV